MTNSARILLSNTQHDLGHNDFPSAEFRAGADSLKKKGQAVAPSSKEPCFRSPVGPKVRALSWRHPATNRALGSGNIFESHRRADVPGGFLSYRKCAAPLASEASRAIRPCRSALPLWWIKKPRAMDGAECFRYGWRACWDSLSGTSIPEFVSL